MIPQIMITVALMAASLFPQSALAQSSGVDARYLPGLEDLPLAPGVFAINAAPLRFDSPGGRIVVVYAEGRNDRASISAFYGQTLSPVGWERLEPLLFRRDGETLRIEVDDLPPITRVRFFLAPAKP